MLTTTITMTSLTKFIKLRRRRLHSTLINMSTHQRQHHIQRFRHRITLPFKLRQNRISSSPTTHMNTLTRTRSRRITQSTRMLSHTHGNRKVQQSSTSILNSISRTTKIRILQISSHQISINRSLRLTNTTRIMTMTQNTMTSRLTTINNITRLTKLRKLSRTITLNRTPSPTIKLSHRIEYPQSQY